MTHSNEDFGFSLLEIFNKDALVVSCQEIGNFFDKLCINKKKIFLWTHSDFKKYFAGIAMIFRYSLRYSFLLFLEQLMTNANKI